MAKPPKKNYDSGNTKQETNTSGIFGNNSVMGSASDYDSWDWKQIEAVIVGGSNLSQQNEVDRAHTVASPQSLYDAGDTFQYVHDVLQMVSENLVAQAQALAGNDDSPWKGAAADAFMDMMQTFSSQVAASTKALAGGSTGESVAQTLVDAGNQLAVAQANIITIDNWYAQQALKIGIKPMKNGLVPVSQSPKIVQMMTDDMRRVLHTLAGHYSVETRMLNQVSPTGITPTTGDGGGALPPMPTDPGPLNNFTSPTVPVPVTPTLPGGASPGDPLGGPNLNTGGPSPVTPTLPGGASPGDPLGSPNLNT
ncbi:WXG100 family type VII secretion target, partial [Streptomyces sp. NPDC001617]